LRLKAGSVLQLYTRTFQIWPNLGSAGTCYAALETIFFVVSIAHHESRNPESKCGERHDVHAIFGHPERTSAFRLA
jgi:hypothetical protein